MPAEAARIGTSNGPCASPQTGPSTVSQPHPAAARIGAGSGAIGSCAVTGNASCAAASAAASAAACGGAATGSGPSPSVSC